MVGRDSWETEGWGEHPPQSGQLQLSRILFQKGNPKRADPIQKPNWSISSVQKMGREKGRVPRGKTVRTQVSVQLD